MRHICQSSIYYSDNHGDFADVESEKVFFLTTL
jgi:hypothetical protein